MAEDELKAFEALVAIELRPVHGANLRWQPRRVIESDPVEALAAAREHESHVVRAHATLLGDVELIVEQGSWKSLAPNLGFERSGQTEIQFLRRKLSIGFERLIQHVGGQLFPADSFELVDEAGQRMLAERQTRRECVAAKPCDDVGRSLGHQIERVSEMETRDRSAGSAQATVLCASEHNGWPMETILEPRCDDPHDALMPIRTVQAQRVRVGTCPIGRFIG